MKINNILVIRVLLLVCILLFSTLVVIAEPIEFADFIKNDSSSLDYLRYDRFGDTYMGYEHGSASYADGFFENDNIYARVCHPDFGNGSFVDYRYYSESINITSSLMNFLPEVLNISDNPDFINSSYCDTLDIDISTVKSAYPGYVLPFIVTGNGSYPLYNHKELLNGSFEIGVAVDSPPKVYYFFVRSVRDNNNQSIVSDDDSMVISFVDDTNVSRLEGTVRPFEYFPYYGDMSGKETVYVNGMSSLEIIPVGACAPINKTGYYLLNESLSNVNETCIVIENATEVVLNFGDDIIDGDYEQNGSLSNESCSIFVKDSTSITIENIRSQNFLHGLCVENSTVNVFGDYSSHHINGMLVEDNSVVRLVDVGFSSNNEVDIIALNNSHVYLEDVDFNSANITSEFVDVNVTGVEIFPDYDNFTDNDMDHINQLIQYTNTSNTSWAKISFIYETPLPNHVGLADISVYKYNGTYVNYTESVFNNVTNITTNTTQIGWYGGNWTKLLTTISPSDRLISAENMSNFSVFAPFGSLVDPLPEPEPDPDPTDGGPTGGGGGSGSSRGKNDETALHPDAITFDLEFPEIVAVKQGEFIDIPFNISYTGGIPAYNVTVSIAGEKGWETIDYTKDEFIFGENATGTLAMQPYIKTRPQKMLVPVLVTVDIAGGQQLVLERLMYVDILPRGDLSIIKVLEYPPVIKINPNSKLDVSFLIENVGDLDIDDIYIKYDPSPCLTNVSGLNDIAYGEIKNFEYRFISGDPNTCDYNIKFYSGDKLVGFVPVKFIITKLGWIDLEKDTQISILLFLLIIWTAITMVVFSKEREKLLLEKNK